MIFILDRPLIVPLSFFKWRRQLSLSSNVRPRIRILLEKVKGEFIYKGDWRQVIFFLFVKYDALRFWGRKCKPRLLRPPGKDIQGKLKKMGGSFNLRSAAVDMAIVREKNVFNRFRDFFADVINGVKKESNAESRSLRKSVDNIVRLWEVVTDFDAKLTVGKKIFYKSQEITIQFPVVKNC